MAPAGLRKTNRTADCKLLFCGTEQQTVSFTRLRKSKVLEMESQQEVSLLIEGQVFKVKKDLLCEYSDYFRAMFSGNYVEKEQQEIHIDVVDANSMNIITRYMEIGLIDISDYPLSTVGDLAVAANFLQITELTKQINYCLEQSISLSNFLEIRDIALNAPSMALEQAAVTYGLFSFKHMKPELVPSINSLFWYLSHAYLNTESELYVFKFGLQWIELQEMGADALLIILCCLDMNRLTSIELKEMKDLIKNYVNSLIEKVVDCLYKLAKDYELSTTAIKGNKQVLCELYTEKVYTEVLNIVNGSIQRKLRFIPAVPMWSDKHKNAELSENYLYTYTEEEGFRKWIELSEKKLWGWNLTNWTPTKIVKVCGEYGRGARSYMRDVKVYDVLKKEWIQHGVELPLRRHAGVCVVEDSLYILGGVGGYRVVLETAIIYNLKERSFRRIADLPDALQSPAVCAHEKEVYMAGLQHIYKYEDTGEHERWAKVVDTDIMPTILVSFKGYIYAAQSYFPHLHRFRPGVDASLQLIGGFNHIPVAICNLGYRLVAITRSGDVVTDFIYLEEFQDASIPSENVKLIWSQTCWQLGVNSTGSCSVVMTQPPTNPDVSPFHQRYLTMYGTVSN